LCAASAGTVEEFNALTDVAFVSLLATYSCVAKSLLLWSPMDPLFREHPIQSFSWYALILLGDRTSLQAILSAILLTSGTLSPIDLYPKLLQFEPGVSEAFSMSTFRPLPAQW
jgi:DNA excision repair protein ERCC-2